ncbi:hypothetical protein [Paractinoplanes atraurantiacus]|uniref:Uncharacterized protein n=1 Tax=Paractinoplanes atraurantiacus TaxID=1036182 RepID=A0A285I499_9ACTN|nr:hypothetical protein [Actinoplanes atraurantiacus]SNY42815.1 hypothetical protein SAMN05421748_106336 [Actinoplanes atraurantiacus]
MAYLLFTHRRMAEQAVLVLGPSPRFLEYISQVLPALGETAVVSATCDTLVPQIAVGRAESRRLSEIKGRALWQPALEHYIGSLLPRAREMKLRWEGEFHLIGAEAVGQALASATQGRSYHRARAAFAEQLHHLLAGAVAEQRAALLEEMEEGFEDILARVDKSMGRDCAPAPTRTDDEELEELRDRIAADAGIAKFVEAWWPARDPEVALREFLSSSALLGRFAPELSAEEVELVVSEPGPWAASDIPLLDAIAELLGDTGDPHPQGEFLAERA